MDLITHATPQDPVLDIALSHALLREVAAGRRPPSLRLFVPGPTVAFGRLDALRPGFARACDVARAHGHVPVVRPAGGHAAVYGPDCLIVEHLTREEDVTAGLEARFAAQAALLRDALADLGADARIGELPGEYCAGAHSINLGGRIKVAGIAQRAIRHGALTTAVVVAGGGPALRALIGALYDALGLVTDTGTAGAVDEGAPGATPARVADAIRARAGALTPAAVDAPLLAAARALAPRHRAA